MGLVARGSAFTHSDMRLYILAISKLTCHLEEWAPTAALYFNREVIAICFFKVVGGAYWRRSLFVVSRTLKIRERILFGSLLQNSQPVFSFLVRNIVASLYKGLVTDTTLSFEINRLIFGSKQNKSSVIV